MTVINRWILSAQNRCANIWYNDDYTVYGLNPVPGMQAPSDANTVTLNDLGNGTIALQCGGGYNAFASVRDDYGYQVQFQAPYSADWITGVGADEILQAIPTGDGYFALYSPHFGRYVTINPNPNPKANNCTPLTARGGDIGQAARFTATGLDRNSVFDFLQVGGNATGLSFAGVDLANRNL
ncbi:MAG: fascin domain-containing protein, partial [Mycobacterium sp.]